MTQEANDHLILISGKSATGKSMCLRNLKDPEGVVYLNAEAGKRLPFQSKFKQITITDPLVVYQAFEQAEAKNDIHTIVVDSLTFCMDMYEQLYVNGSANGLKAWADYAAYFKRLMQQFVAKSTKNVIFTAHTADVYNESDMVNETMVKLKGSVMNQGVESYFSNVISTKKVPIKKLEGYSSPLLNITEEEKLLSFKYVFQTKLTKDTVNERIRGPLGMWDVKETMIDNDAQLVIDRLHQYYV